MALSTPPRLTPRSLSSLFFLSGLLHLPQVSAINIRRGPQPTQQPQPNPGAYSLYPYPDSNPVAPDYTHGMANTRAYSSGLIAPNYSYGIPQPQQSGPAKVASDYTHQSNSQDPYAQSSSYGQASSYPQDPYGQSSSSYPRDPTYPQEPSYPQDPYSANPSAQTPSYPFANDSVPLGDNGSYALGGANDTYSSPFGSPVSSLVGSSVNMNEYVTNPKAEPIALCSPNSSSNPPDSTGCQYAMTDLKGEVKWYDKDGPTDWGPTGSGTEAVCGKQWTGSSCVITIGCQTQFQATYSDISTLASYVIGNCVSNPVDGKVAPGIGYYNDFSHAPWWITVTESSSHTDTTMQDFIADLSIYTSQGGFGSEISQSQLGSASEVGRPSFDASRGGAPSSAGLPSGNQGDYLSNLDLGLGGDGGSGSGSGNGNGDRLASGVASLGVQPSPTTVHTPLSSATGPSTINLMSGAALKFTTAASTPSAQQTNTA